MTSRVTTSTKIVPNSDSDKFEALHLRRDGEDACYFDFSVCQLGTFMTAGRTSTVTVRIEDSPDTRCLLTNLSQWKRDKFDGLVSVTFNEDQYYTMDQSLWMPLADGLFALCLSVDCAKLGI
jgi:hypothetical protein